MPPRSAMFEKNTEDMESKKRKLNNEASKKCIFNQTKKSQDQKKEFILKSTVEDVKQDENFTLRNFISHQSSGTVEEEGENEQEEQEEEWGKYVDSLWTGNLILDQSWEDSHLHNK